MAAPSEFMAEALRLARRGCWAVSPNPMVGAVVVRGGRVVGRGWHRRFGGAHAEVEALRAAGPRARGGDLYVTLEPCAHRGKTPPCAEAILRAGLARVFYAAADPNPLTSGRGPSVLRRAGVKVAAGLLASEARDLLRPYLHRHATGRPWVILKWAMTLDGKIATRTGASRWITSEPARALAHKLRRRADAVVVGTRTALLDDPILLPRPALGRMPARVILDRRGRLPLSLKLFEPGGGGRRIYVTARGARLRRIRAIQARGIEVLELPERRGGLPLAALLRGLCRRGVGQLLVEGGGSLIGSFLDARLAQEAAVFVAPVIFGGEAAKGPAGGRGVAGVAQAVRLLSPRIRRVGADFLVEGRIAGARR